MSNLLAIDDQGQITTRVNDAFDFERQEQVIVQIQAGDTLGEPYHKTFAQLTIDVIDVNDESPEIRMPRNSTRIAENSKANTIVTDQIQAKDVDTDADLEFSILWDDSYATKNGQEVDSKLFEG